MKRQHHPKEGLELERRTTHKERVEQPKKKERVGQTHPSLSGGAVVLLSFWVVRLLRPSSRFPQGGWREATPARRKEKRSRINSPKEEGTSTTWVVLRFLPPSCICQIGRDILHVFLPNTQDFISGNSVIYIYIYIYMSLH